MCQTVKRVHLIPLMIVSSLLGFAVFNLSPGETDIRPPSRLGRVLFVATVTVLWKVTTGFAAFLNSSTPSISATS